MRLIRQLFLRFADRIYRQHDPKKDASYLRLIVVHILAFMSLFAGSFLILGKISDRSARPVVEIPAASWSVLIGHDDVPCWSTTDQALCPARPMNPQLWNAGLKRWSRDYYSALGEDRTRPFWMGIQIPPEQLKKANAEGATRLMLGLLFSRYEVWIDGRRVQTGNYLENDLPVAIDIARDRLQVDVPLSVAIIVFRDGKMRTMDSSWFVPALGLFTSRAADQQMRWVIFTGDTRFLIMFAVFILFGTIFRFAAQADPSKEEFRAAALVSFVLALTQVIMADSTFRVLEASLYYRFLTAFSLGEVAAILALGFAAARSRRALVIGASAAAPILILFSLFLPSDLFTDGELTQFILTWLTPAAYVTSGLVCLAQFVKIQATSHLAGVAPSPHRNTTLLVLTFMMICIASAFIMESAQAIAVETHWARYLILFPLLGLATTLAADVRRNIRLVETTPISSFHKMPKLPSEVPGLLINLDLKGSEALFRAGSGQGSGGTIVSTVISQIWGRFAASGATILQSSGDDLIVLFDEPTLERNPNVWIETLEAAHEELQLIAQTLADAQVELSTLKTIEFRASVARGSVRPMWRTVGVTRVPNWVEAGSRNVFVESARLLELERTLKLTGQGSTVIFADSAELQAPKGYRVEVVEGIGKHDVSYRANVILISNEKTIPQSA